MYIQSQGIFDLKVDEYLILCVMHQLTTKVMFILSSVCRGSDFWSVNHSSTKKTLNQMFLKIENLLSEIFNNWQNHYLEEVYTKLFY